MQGQTLDWDDLNMENYSAPVAESRPKDQRRAPNEFAIWADVRRRFDVVRGDIRNDGRLAIRKRTNTGHLFMAALRDQRAPLQAEILTIRRLRRLFRVAEEDVVLLWILVRGTNEI